MTTPMPAPAVLDREYLEIRAKILELAASLDRLDRGAGDVSDDPRMALIRRGFELLRDSDGQRAEQIQHLFSLEYDPQWRTEFGI